MPIDSLSLFEPIASILGVLAQVLIATASSIIVGSLARLGLRDGWPWSIVLLATVVAVLLLIFAVLALLASPYAAAWFLPIVAVIAQLIVPVRRSRPRW